MEVLQKCFGKSGGLKLVFTYSLTFYPSENSGTFGNKYIFKVNSGGDVLF